MKHVKGALTALTALVLAIAPLQSAPVQTADELASIRKEIQALKDAQLAILKELQEIRQALTGRQAPAPNPVISVAGAPFRGKADARLTLIEFSDYQ